MKILYALIIMVSLISCSKQPAENATVDCSGPPKTYSLDVSKVLGTSCNDDSGCHGSGSKNGPGELLNFQQVFNARTAIRSAISSGRMPVNGKLTTEEKNAILCWIDNGSPNN